MEDYILKIGKVVSNEDELDGNRIKVRIKGEDDYKTDSEIDYSFPLLPKMFLATPKIGEAVLVMTTATKHNFGSRFFIGPIISQLYNLNYDSANIGGLSLLNEGVIKPKDSEQNNPNKIGKYPSKDDIAIQGRYNSDIILKDNELRIRCGQINTNDDYNNSSIGFIQLKNNPVGQNFKTSVNVVADEINLISHKHSKKFNTNNPTELISDSELENIYKYAYSIPYGEILVDFLNKFLNVFLTHSHPYDCMKPNETLSVKTLREINLEEILSKNIKIN